MLSYVFLKNKMIIIVNKISWNCFTLFVLDQKNKKQTNMVYVEQSQKGEVGTY